MKRPSSWLDRRLKAQSIGPLKIKKMENTIYSDKINLLNAMVMTVFTLIR